MLSTMRQMGRALAPGERRSALGMFGLTVVGMLLETLGVGLVVPVIALMTQPDFKIAPSFPSFQFLDNLAQGEIVVIAVVGLTIIYLVKNCYLTFLIWQQARFAFGVQANLSQRLFEVYLFQPYTFHLERNSAQLIRNLTGEIAVFTQSILAALNLVSEGLVLLGILVLLLFMETTGTLAVVAVLGGAALLFHGVTRNRAARWGSERQHHDGLRIKHLQQGLGGAKDMKLLGREREFLTQYRVANYGSAMASRFQAVFMQLPRLWLEMLAVAGLAVAVIVMLSQGRAVVSIVPTLALFAAAAFRLMPSVNRILASAQALRYGQTAVAHLEKEAALAVQRTPATDHAPLAFSREIEVSGMSYRYPSTPVAALDNLSFKIAKGEAVGFVGPSGSGKSTLVDVILGLLRPDAGRILVDGKDIQQHLRGWQSQIGYVPQSIFLTDDTLRRNIAFGLPDDRIDDAAVAKAIAAAQLESFVSDLPQGLQTVVGERGVRLSGGQRQRIGIARALYHDPAVLVLDEATSALDIATEQGIIEAMKALKGVKTVLVVAHRLTTIEHCDRVFRLDRGCLGDEGIATSRNPRADAVPLSTLT